MTASRFLTLDQVFEELCVSKAQVTALSPSQDLRAMKIGGRGLWRIGRDDLEAYIERTYAETAAGSTSTRSPRIGSPMPEPL